MKSRTTRGLQGRSAQYSDGQHELLRRPDFPAHQRLSYRVTSEPASASGADNAPQRHWPGGCPPHRLVLHTARSGSALATPYFVGAALGYRVITTFYVKRTPFLVATMTVHQGSALAGPMLEELATGTRVLAVGAENGELEHRLSRHTRLRPGDELLVTGPVTRIIDLVRRNQPASGDFRQSDAKAR